MSIYEANCVFINLFREHKLNDVAKELRYAEYYQNIPKKNLDRMNKICSISYYISFHQIKSSIASTTAWTL